MKKRTILLIAETAISIALIVVVQLIGRLLPTLPLIPPLSLQQLITGSLVNLVLIITLYKCGILYGSIAGAISAIFALILGIGPAIPVITIAVIFGNVTIVFAYYLFNIKFRLPKIITVFIGAALKGLIMFIIVTIILQLGSYKEAQVKTLSGMFSWVQIITATIGGLLSLAVYQGLKIIPDYESKTKIDNQ